MTVFATAIPAPKARNRSVIFAATVAAGIITVETVFTLFSYDQFMSLYRVITAVVGLPWLAILLPVSAGLGVFSLPFLLRMTLSPAFRFVSMVFGWLLVVLNLFFCGVFIQATGLYLQGLVEIGVNLAVGALIAYSAWGLWPLRQAKPDKK